MKKLFWLAVAGMLTSAPAHADTAKDYNLFVFGNYTGTSDTEGRVAVGGNANLSSYSVGDKLGSGFNGQDSLVVGGALTFNGGSVDYGNVVTGQPSTYTYFGAPNGTTRVASGAADFPVDFAAEAIRLKALSTTLAGLTANGTVGNYYGQVQLSGANAGLNVFDISGAALAAATSFQVVIPDGAFALFNIDGVTAKMQNFGFFSDFLQQNSIGANGGSRFLFNFHQATSLTIGGISVRGSVLAPFADLKSGYGTVDGNLIIASGNSPLQINYYPYLGDLLDPPTGAVPEPASWAMMIVGFGSVGLGLRMQRRRRVLTA